MASTTAIDFLVSKGWTREQAAGVAANLKHESNFNPTAVGDGGKAYGIAQWHPNRQQDFAAWAGKDIRKSTMEDQLGFLHHELTAGKERSAGNRLRSAQSAEDAGDVVSRYYERPADTEGEAARRANSAATLLGLTGTRTVGKKQARGVTEDGEVLDRSRPVAELYKGGNVDVNPGYDVNGNSLGGPGITAFPGGQNSTDLSAAEARSTDAQKAKDDLPFWGSIYKKESVIGAAYPTAMTPSFRLVEGLLNGFPDQEPAYVAYIRNPENYDKERADYTDRERELIDSAASFSELTNVKFRIAEDRENAEITSRASGAGQFSAALLAGMLDPTTWATGFAASGALAAVGRGSYALANAGRPGAALMSAASEGAIGNVGYELAHAAMGEQKSGSDYAIAAVSGALMGAVVGTFAYRKGSQVQAQQSADALKLAQAAADNKARFVSQALADLGETATPAELAAHAAKLEAKDMMEAIRLQSRPIEGDRIDTTVPNLGDDATAVASAVLTNDVKPRELAPLTQADRAAADARVHGERAAKSEDEVVAEAVVDEATLTAQEKERSRRLREKYPAPIRPDDSTMPTSAQNLDLWRNGIILEIDSVQDLLKYSASTVNRARRGIDLPDHRAKALYDAGDDMVYLIRKNMTKEELANPQGLISHEVGVHYGLERTVGYERFAKIIGDIENSLHPDAVAARSAVPENTPAYLRGEEMLGYLAENGKTNMVKSVIASVRNFLRNNIRAFKNMEVTVQDALAYIRGSVKRARMARISRDNEFPYVWHGSAVANIEKFDLSYAGSGEGNAGYGFGHYMTSERATGLDYRNKESARRGKEGEEGGLYRNKLGGKQEDYMSWDTAIDDSMNTRIPEATEGITGKELYKLLTKKYGTQKAASEYLSGLGVRGHRYDTGRTRKAAVKNSNYVVYADPDVSVDVRYSFGTDMMPESSPEEKGMKKLVEDMYVKAVDWVKRNPSDPERLKTVMSKVGMETPGQLLAQSHNPVAQWFAGTVTEHTLGASGRRTTASIRSKMLQENYTGNTLTQFEGSYELWRNETYGRTKGFASDLTDLKAYEDFNTQVMTLAESRLQGYPVQAHPMVVKATDALQDSYTRMLVSQKDAKTTGWAVLPTDSVGYIPHSLDAQKIAQMPVTHLEVYKNALAQQLENLSGFDKDFAEKVARAYLDHARINAHAGHEIPANIMDPAASGYVDQALKAAGLTPAQIAAFQGKLASGGASHTKKRLTLDLNAVHKLPDGTELRLSDLYKKDMTMLLKNQARRVSGEVALVEQGIMGSAGLDVVGRALQFGDAANKTTLTPAQTQAFQQVSAELLGRPYGDAMPRGLEALTTATAQAKLGGMGITQIGETMNLALQVGLNHAISFTGSIPRLIGEVRTLAKGGKVDNPVLGSIELYGGQGEFGLQGYKMVTAYTDPTTVNDTVGRSAAGPVARLFRKTGQAFKVMTAHRIIEAVQRRGVAEQITIKALRAIRDGGSDKRLADMGFNPDMIARLRNDLPNAVVWSGNRVKEFDIRKFKDLEAGAAFAVAIRRGSGQVIQEGFVGEIAHWQHSTVGKVLSQFRNYPLLAMEKQYGRTRAINGGGLQGHAIAGALMVAAAGMALPLHLARVQFNAIGRADADAYIDKMTEPAAMLRATLNYIALSGMMQDFVALTQEGIDTATGEKQAGRSTLGSVVPAFGYVESLMALPRNITDPRALQRVLPLGNTPLMVQLFNQWAD